MTGRAKALPDFAIGNKVADLDRNKLLKIGTTPTYALRRQLQEMITERYEGVDRPRVKAKIAAVDRAKTKTYEGGCRFLHKWYREKFWSYPDTRPDADRFYAYHQNVPNDSEHVLQFTILRSNKERVLYFSNFLK